MAKKTAKPSASKALKSFARNRADAFEPEAAPTAEVIKVGARGRVRLDNWTNILTGAGVAGADKRMAGQAVWTGIMYETRAEQVYASGELERRVVELIPRECLKNWIKFDGLEDAETDMEEELNELNASAKFYEASCWANIYGGAALFLATGEDPDDFMEPLDPKNFDKVEALQLFSRWELQVRSTDLETDINNPNFGQPKFYWLTPRKGNASKLNSVRIHHTRLIIFGGKPLPLRLRTLNNYWDDSIYSGILEVLRDYGISHASIASVLQEFRQVVYKIKELTEGLGSIDGDAIKARLATMNTVKSVFGAYIADMDEEVEIHSDTFSGVADMLQAIKERMQACTNIPHIILFNESPGGKSSMGTTGDSSLESWYSYLEGHQKNYYKPKIDQLLAAMMQASEGPTAGKEPEGWTWEFNKIQSMDEGQQADLEGKQYENDAKAQALGIDSAMDTMQKRRPKKFKELNIKPDKMLEASMQQLIRAEMEKFGNPGDLEGTGGEGLDMSDPLFQTRSASPATSGPQGARGKKRSDEEPAWVAGLLDEIKQFSATRLDMNENHDPKNGEFSSGPGGTGEAHHLAKAAKFKKSEAKHREKAGGAYSAKANGAADQARLHESLAKAYRESPVNSYLQGAGKGATNTAKPLADQSTSGAFLYHNGPGASSPDGKPGVYVGAGRPNIQGGQIGKLDKEAMDWHLKNGSFSTVSAFNPPRKEGEPARTPKENSDKTAQLIEDLHARGATYKVVEGKYAENPTDPGASEASVIIFHDAKFGPQDARELGAKYQQDSILNSNKGRAVMVFTTNTTGHLGTYHQSTGPDDTGHAAWKDENNSNTDNYYTRVSGNKYSYDFDFGTHKQE